MVRDYWVVFRVPAIGHSGQFSDAEFFLANLKHGINLFIIFPFVNFPRYPKLHDHSLEITDKAAPKAQESRRGVCGSLDRQRLLF
jgi:hypothetical protein